LLQLRAAQLQPVLRFIVVAPMATINEGVKRIGRTQRIGASS